MWFRGKDGKAENDARRSGPNARPREPRKGGRRALPKIAWVPLAALAGLALAAWLVWKMGGWLFWGNADYTLRKLIVQVDGQVITANHVREYTGLREGTNLFALNLGQIRADFLKKTPLAKSIVIQRRLPDTAIVTVVERIPLARLGRGSSQGVDRDGYVFSLRSGSREFPVITGGSIESAVRLGARVDQPVLNAIEALEACNRAKAGEQVKIASIDVSAKEYLDLYLAAGERVRLAWAGMGQPMTPDMHQELEKKITYLAAVLRAAEERGRRVVNLDLTYGDQYVPAQEY